VLGFVEIFACLVVETNRPGSPAMREALLIKIEQEGIFRIRGRLEHIPTGDNTIEDLLSHTRIEEASQLLSARWGFVHRIEIDESFIAESLRRVRTAIGREFQCESV